MFKLVPFAGEKSADDVSKVTLMLAPTSLLAKPPSKRVTLRLSPATRPSTLKLSGVNVAAVVES